MTGVTDMARLIVLDVDGPASARLRAAAAAAGDSTVVVGHRGDSGRRRPGVSPTQLSVDFGRPDDALGPIVDLGQRIGADGVVTANEYLTPLAARACHALGLPGNDPDRASAARSKIDMAFHLAEAGVRTPPVRLVEPAGSMTVTLPCVVKPSAAAGSQGVEIVHHRSELDDAIRRSQRVTERDPYGSVTPGQVIVQPYVDGAEYSVECVSQHGQHVPLSVVAKTTSAGRFRTELAHTAPAAVSAATRQAILDTVRRGLTALGIRHGASHTEVKVDRDGVVWLIEAAARIGGHPIGDLVQATVGVDMWRACVDVAVGRPVHLRPAACASASVRFFTAPRAGRVVGIDGLPRLGGPVRSVQLKKRRGDVVAEPSSNKDRVGHLVIVAEPGQDVDRIGDDILSRIRVLVTPEPATLATPTPAPRPGERTER